MKTILPVSDPNVYARFLGAPVLHPLVSVIHYDEISPIHSSLNRYGVYGLFIQRNFPKNLTYGMKMFDAADGSIIAVEPGQIGGKEDDGERIHISGWALLFAPELLHGTDLEPRMKEYRFFSYFATETLKMEPAEWGRITQLLTQLKHELQENEGRKVTPEQWVAKWNGIAGIIRKDFSGIPGSEEDLARLDSLVREGKLIMHHSPAFSDAYHPHYRIVAKDIFESELKPLIDR